MTQPREQDYEGTGSHEAHPTVDTPGGHELNLDVAAWSDGHSDDNRAADSTYDDATSDDYVSSQPFDADLTVADENSSISSIEHPVSEGYDSNESYDSIENYDSNEGYDSNDDAEADV
jgi:hypothetical protein